MTKTVRHDGIGILRAMLVAQGTLTAKRISQSWQMFDRRLEGGKPPVTTVGRKWKMSTVVTLLLADYIVTAEL